MPGDLPVLALHGWLGRAEDWSPVSAALGAGAGFLSADLPGHGMDDSEAEFSMEDGVDRGVRALDGAGVERAVVAGYSMGGRVALHLALLHPDRVAGLVLVSCSAGLATEAEREARRAEDAARAQRLVANPGAFLADWYAAPLFNPLPGAARAALAADRLAHIRPEGWARALVGLSVGAQQWLGDRLHEIRVPVAVLAGSVDAKFVALAHEMAAAGTFEATIIPDAGHALLVERPEAVARAIERLSD